jgi:hypothetical protein
VFPNLRRMHLRTSPYVNNSLSISFASFSFRKNEKNSWEHGNMGTYRIGELPWHNTLGFFYWGEIPQNTHRNKKGVVYGLSF